MNDLETLIAELAADEKSYGRDTTYIGASAVVKIGRELLAARKVVEAARAIPLGFDDAGGPLAATMAALDAALSAHDAAEVARNEKDVP